jgi:hypothetical protein
VSAISAPSAPKVPSAQEESSSKLKPFSQIKTHELYFTSHYNIAFAYLPSSCAVSSS